MSEETKKVTNPVTGDELSAEVVAQLAKDLGFVPKTEAEEMAKIKANTVVQARLKEEKEKQRKDKEAELQRYEELQKSATMSQEQQEALASQIEHLQEELMTADQRAEKKIKGEVFEKEQKIKKLEKEKAEWEQEYKQLYTRNAIVESASKHDPLNPTNFIDSLALRETWESVRDPETGELGKPEPKYKLTVKDDEGNPQEGLFPVDKAVEILAAQNPHWLKNTTQSGLGTPGNYSAGYGSTTVGEFLAKNPTPSVEQYLELKKKGAFRKG